MLAVGLTSEPNIPDIPHTGEDRVPTIHTRDVGQYCRENLGYQPIPQTENHSEAASPTCSFPKSVAVYGGAKSAFDLVHLFASLHRNAELFHLGGRPPEPVQVHWVIREDGGGPAWMMLPTTKAGDKEMPSDQAGYTRMMGLIDRQVYEVPKRIVWPSSSAVPRIEGSWSRRLLHENRLGRAGMRQLWKQVDASLNAYANYSSQEKMAKLLPQG